MGDDEHVLLLVPSNLALTLELGDRRGQRTALLPIARTEIRLPGDVAMQRPDIGRGTHDDRAISSTESTENATLRTLDVLPRRSERLPASEPTHTATGSWRTPRPPLAVSVM